MLQNNQGVSEEIKDNIKNTCKQVKMEINDPMCMRLNKSNLRGKFIVIQAYLRKEEISQISI